MPRMVERLQALLRETGRGPVLAIVALLLLLALALVAIWFSLPSSQGQEAAEQDASGGQYTTTSESRSEDFPLIFGPGPSPDLARAVSADGRPQGIPGLSEMEVIGYLQYVPDTDFRCPVGGPAGGGLSRRVCTLSATDNPAVYEVSFLMDRAVVLAVVATASDASEDEAAEVLGYVAGLSLEDASPIDAESWVGRNIASGGQYFTDGAEVRLYGTEGSRTLEIVANVPPAISNPETTDESLVTTEETTDRRPR